MGIDFTVFKGSKTGQIVEAKGHREPGPTEVLVQISHCGVCGTDEHYRHADQGLGHESVGTIVEVGSLVGHVSDFKVGDRVGMGWFQWFCGYCKHCTTGHQNRCDRSKFFGQSNVDQGGFGTAAAWDVSALFRIPDAIAPEHAGPLMCGGATVWGPLADEGARPGDRVGIVGVGGLGHLAIQFAAKMGLEPVVFSGSESKREDAFRFGASEFHATAGVEKLEGVDKVDYLLITTSFIPDLSTYFPVLSNGAKVFPLTGSFDNLRVTPIQLIATKVRIVGVGVAPSASIRAMLGFAARHRVEPQIEEFPMTQAGVTEAMQKLRDGKMRYRGVVVR